MGLRGSVPKLDNGTRHPGFVAEVQPRACGGAGSGNRVWVREPGKRTRCHVGAGAINGSVARTNAVTKPHTVAGPHPTSHDS
jgi:hypothetical protein